MVSYHKYVVSASALLFVISGIATLTVGSIVYKDYSHYSQFVYVGYHSVPLVLIIAGILTIINSFIGYYGIVNENVRMVIIFPIFLVLIIVLEVVGGVLGFVKKNGVESMLEYQLNSTMPKYYTNPDIKYSWDIVQHEVECCGVKGLEDWLRITQNNSLPLTCCPDSPDHGSCTIQNPNVYQVSCVEKLKDVFFKYGDIVGGVGLGIAALQLFGIILACCLFMTCSLMEISLFR